MNKVPNIIVRKSCPYSRDQLVEAANAGFRDKFKIKTRGTRKTIGPLTLNVGFGRSTDEILAARDLSWVEEPKE